MRVMTSRLEHQMLEEIEDLSVLLHEFKHSLRRLMTALETLTEAVTTLGTEVTALTASVDHAVTHMGAPPATDAQLLTLAETLVGLTAALAAQKTRLDTASGEEPVAP